MPTAHAAPPLAQKFARSASRDLPPVWPDPEGSVRGLEVSPLYRSAPNAAKRDADLYRLLALVDAIRGGRARRRASRAVAVSAHIAMFAPERWTVW
jgi:hypothetical protein